MNKTLMARLALSLFIMANVLATNAWADPKPGDKFGDWTYGCNQANDKKDACYLSQAVLDKKTNTQIMLLQFSRNDESKALTLITILPLGIHFSSGVNGNIDKNNKVKLVLQTCLAMGCIASYAPDKNEIKPLMAGKLMEVNFAVKAGKQPVTIPVSLNGLADGAKAAGLTNSGWFN